jgi:hypothetical protein
VVANITFHAGQRDYRCVDAFVNERGKKSMSEAKSKLDAAIVESLLSTALQARSRLEIDGAGGTDGLWRLFRCVGRIQAGPTWLGSCTVLPGGRFALTAAHVVSIYRRPPGYSVVIPALPSDANVKVRRLHWQTGEIFDCNAGKESWPPSVEQYGGDRDCLVLLELEKPFSDDVVDAHPRLPGMTAPHEGDWLITAGFGEDAVGNRMPNVWTATSRHIGRDAAGFGLHAPRRTDLYCGMPRAGDSGGPVFWQPMSNPFGRRYLRLAGVHSERIPDPETGRERARYLRIDHLASAWIRSRVRQSQPRETGVAASPEEPTLSRNVGNVEFCHRKAKDRKFYTFNDPPEEIHDVSFDVEQVKGRILVEGSKGYTKVVGNKVELTLELKDQNKVQTKRTVTLRRSDICGGGHWYQNEADPPDTESFPLYFYLFKLTKEPKPPKGGTSRGDVVFIEVFVKDSGHIHPSEETLFEPGCTQVACRGRASPTDDPWEPGEDEIAMPTPDQDDEGNGHEDPP